MIDLFGLEDIDTSTALDDAVYLEMVVRFPDGTSSLYFRDIQSEDDIPEATEWILDHDMARRIDRLSPDERETYSEDYDPGRSTFGSSGSGCTCRGACFCYDVPEEVRDDFQEAGFTWLSERVRPGVIVTWRCRPFHATGTAIVTEPSIGFAFAEVALTTDESGEVTERADPIALLYL